MNGSPPSKTGEHEVRQRVRGRDTEPVSGCGVQRVGVGVGSLVVPGRDSRVEPSRIQEVKAWSVMSQQVFSNGRSKTFGPTDKVSCPFGPYTQSSVFHTAVAEVKERSNLSFPQHLLYMLLFVISWYSAIPAASYANSAAFESVSPAKWVAQRHKLSMAKHLLWHRWLLFDQATWKKTKQKQSSEKNTSICHICHRI